MTSTPASYKFVDIGANLFDERFTKGSYRGKVRHEPDFDHVVKRASDIGMRHMILTCGTLAESRKAIGRVRELRELNQTSCELYCTVGVHPTRCMEFEDAESAEANIEELIELTMDGMRDGTVVAVGEMGLDYDRLEFCPKDVQRKYFVEQLRVVKASGLPMFLHNRNVKDELVEILIENRDCWKSGVVHSFDDSLEVAEKLMELGLYIGLNGCSLRSEENLGVVKMLPVERILLETDCPYCGIKRTHAGFSFVRSEFESKQEKKYERGVQVKGRNEPCNIIQVAEVVAGVKGMEVGDLVEAVFNNSLDLYGWKE